MNRIVQRFFLTAFIAAAAGLLSAAFSPVFAQSNSPEAGHGAPQDWSHRHLLYTNPDTRDEAARKGTLAFEKWKEQNKDPRFTAQVARKTRFVHGTEGSPFSPEQQQWAHRHRRDPPPTTGQDVHRDWSYVLGGVSGVGKAGVFPAKYGPSFTTADCVNDFVVYTTTSAGVTGTTPTPASVTGTFPTTNTTPSGTVIITKGTAITLTASTTLNTGLNFLVVNNSAGGAAANAASLAAAIVRNGGTIEMTATSASGAVTVRSMRGGSAITFTRTGTLTTISWGTLAAGTGTQGQPTIMAFNNIYSSCTGTGMGPATLWSYNTGTVANTFAQTSPTLSLDGTQVAFVQGTTISGTAASLVLLKPGSTGTVYGPITPNLAASASAYRTGTGCALPCMFIIPLSGAPANTNSSPYVDYAGDTLYVGADNGTLHKFTGVFGYNYNVYTGATPAEVTTGGWPVTVSAGNMLTSPVYDSNGSGLVYVGSASGASTGGQLHSVNPANGALVSSGPLSAASSVGVHDSPIVDWSAQKVYVFVGSGVAAANGTTCTGGPCLTVYQFSAPFTGATTGTSVQVGRSRTTSPGNVFYAGAFDNAYYNSGTSPTGNLYVCGSRTGTVARPTLWKIPITANAMGTPVVGPLLATANTDCSSITEVMNGANDYIYVSVAAGGGAAIVGGGNACTGACIYLYNLTTWGGANWVSTATATDGLAATGGASGIIVDNISATAGASQIYYSTLTSPGDAIQASQAGLQ